MSGSKRWLWRLVCLVALVSVSCTPTPDSTKAPPPLNSPGAQQPTVSSSPAGAPMTAVFCPDVSSSYPRPLLDRAREALADEVEGLLRPGGSGATLYVRTIKENSYGWDAELMPAITVPALPTSLLPLSLPSEPKMVTENPFAKRAEEQKYQAERTAWENEVRRLEAEFQTRKAEQETGVAQARVQLKKQTDQLRQLDPPAASGSDIWGCIQKGSELLAKAPGAKYVIIASDLDEYGAQEKATLSLSGIKTSIVFFHCAQAQECEERRDSWTTSLREAGAAGVKFYSPEERIDDVFD